MTLSLTMSRSRSTTYLRLRTSHSATATTKACLLEQVVSRRVTAHRVVRLGPETGICLLKSSIPGVSAAVVGTSLLVWYCWAAIHTYALGCSCVCRAGPGGVKRMGDDAGWASVACSGSSAR